MKYFNLILTIVCSWICSEIYSQDSGLLNKYDILGTSIERLQLPKELSEVSGLALMGSKHVLMHDDEKGIIYIFNLKSRKVKQKIRISNKNLSEDYEGIAAKGDTIFLSTSNGKIYALLLKNRKYGELIYIKKFETIDKINLEGLCYDAVENLLILPNKIEITKKHKNERAFYAFDIEKEKFFKQPKFSVSLKELKEKFGIDNFSPAAIEINPLNCNYFILSSHEKCVVEVNCKGKIINAVKLDGKKHRQPEGITFLKDYSMVISDEADGNRAILSIIPFRR